MILTGEISSQPNPHDFGSFLEVKFPGYLIPSQADQVLLGFMLVLLGS